MRLIKTNTEQLEIHKSVLSSVILAAVLLLVGLGIIGYTIITPDAAWWTSLFGLGLAILAAVLLKTASSQHIILRKAGESEVRTKYLIGGKIKSITFNSSQVTSVKLAISERTNIERDQSEGTSKIERKRRSDIIIALDDGSEIPIAHEERTVGQISVGKIMSAPLKDEAEQIAALFNVALSITGEEGFNLSSTGNVANLIKSLRNK